MLLPNEITFPKYLNAHQIMCPLLELPWPGKVSRLSGGKASRHAVGKGCSGTAPVLTEWN